MFPIPLSASPELCEAHIKQCQPVLKRLQGKTAEYQSDAEDPQPSLRQIVSVVLNIRIGHLANRGHKACHQPDSNRK